MSFKRSINKVNTYKMTQSTLFNIFIKPYVVELIYDNELMMYVLTVFLYENDEFTILYKNSYRSYNFALLSCLKRIIDTDIPICDIANFHRHDFDQRMICIDYSCINSKVCGRFVNAYFHIYCNNMKKDLLKYLWIQNNC